MDATLGSHVDFSLAVKWKRQERAGGQGRIESRNGNHADGVKDQQNAKRRMA